MKYKSSRNFRDEITDSWTRPVSLLDSIAYILENEENAESDRIPGCAFNLFANCHINCCQTMHPRAKVVCD